MYIFYNDSKQNYTIENFNDEININMTFYIEDKIKHLINSAHVIYNIQEGAFINILMDYLENNFVPEVKKNPSSKMKEIDLIKMTQNMTNEFDNDPSLINEFQNFITQKNKELNGDKKHCVICGDNENIVKLIEIPNNPHENKFLCDECYSNQKKDGD